MSRKQARIDYEFLENNVEYFVDENWLINEALPQLIYGDWSVADLIIGSIKDLFYYCYSEENEEDIEFLETNPRVQRIKERYNIKL